MNKRILSLITSLAALTSAQAATVTINALIVEGHKTAAGADITNGTTLAMVVMDTGNDGFGIINTGTSITEGVILGDGNDEIFSIFSTTAADGFLGTPASISKSSFQVTTEVAAPSGVTRNTGEKFAIYWFPTLTTASSQFTTNDTYGKAIVDANWILPSDGGTANAAGITNAGNANLLVGVSSVPEPSSIALLGLGSAAMLLRRRRR